MRDPKYMQSASLILSAASRLVAAVSSPYPALQEASSGMYTSALLNVVVEANITEALKEAGPQGLHVRDLADKVGMEASKLARCLRYLCTRHIYQEVSPDVFANNRISMGLDTGLPFEQVKDRDPHRYDNGIGAAPGVGHMTDENLKGASVMAEILLDPKRSAKVGPATAPTMQAFNFNGGYFDWIEQPGNEKRLHRFTAAMKNVSKFFPPELILTSYDWGTLPKGSIVVDVGGGIGHVTAPLAKNFPDLRFVVQDRPSVISEGDKFWEKELPAALDSKQVQLQAHDFFGPQSIKDAAVFMLRFIIHDWPDVDARKLLKHLRDSATPSTKLLLLEQIVPYTCPVEDELESTVPGAARNKLPEVLQGNPGQGLAMPFILDMQMLNGAGSQERTIGQWNELVESSGWKLERIKRGPVNSIICTPA